MCGRYSITMPVESMSRLFRFGGPLPNLRPRYNVAPTQQVPIVRRAPADGERELAQVRWGLIPFWAKDAKIGYSLINARAEGVDAKPSFREAFKRRRCLIAADGFYEWQKTGGAKQPWRITLNDGGPFAFAGLWERWEKAPDGVPVESCTIVTTPANKLVAKLHDRMPVILPPGSYPAWLGEDSASPAELLALLKPYPPDAMRAYPVRTVVNTPKNDTPECIAPTADQDELGEAVRKLAASMEQRGHAPWFHANNEFQSPMEVYFVGEWAKVINDRHGWNIRNVRKNPDEYPDCLADFGLKGARCPEVIGVEMTELVDPDAIGAHQDMRRLGKVENSGQISNDDTRDLLERMEPVWSLDKFRERLEERVRDKDNRSRDTSLKKQFLLVVTDEQDLNEATLARYIREVSLPRPRNFDAVYLMRSYVPCSGSDGYYPVFEIPVVDA